MDTDCQIFVGIMSFLIMVWMFLETHYFLQICSTMFVSRFIKKSIGVFEETSYYGICTTTDVDVFFDHMNNNRYLRDLDFARADFYVRTRLFKKVIESGGQVVVGANLAIYKRPIRPLVGYNISSKIVYWDNKSIFMEHRFVTSSDAILRATILSQQRFINCDADAILRKLQEPEAPAEKPTMPPEVARLIESIKETWNISQYENTEGSNLDKIMSHPIKGDLNANGPILFETDRSGDVSNRAPTKGDLNVNGHIQFEMDKSDDVPNRACVPTIGDLNVNGQIQTETDRSGDVSNGDCVSIKEDIKASGQTQSQIDKSNDVLKDGCVQRR